MRTYLTLILASLLAACASPPVEPAPHPFAKEPIEFRARLISLTDCPGDFVGFAVPWEFSPDYDPAVRFIRAPEPVSVCVRSPAGFRGLTIGAEYTIQVFAGRYVLTPEEARVQPAIVSQPRL